MLRRLSLGLLASAISVASLPAIAQEDGGADDLGDVMSINLQEMDRPKRKALALGSGQSTHLVWCNPGHMKQQPALQEMKAAFVSVGS